MKTRVFIVFFACLSFVSAASEFWMEAARFKYKKGETATIDFMLADNFEATQWNTQKNKAILLQRYSVEGVEDLTASVKPADKSFPVTLSKEGTQLFALKSNETTQTWSAESFESYLTDQGLEEISTFRSRTKKTVAPATTLETHAAKILIQSGSVTDKTFQQHTDLSLEIVPLSNPYLLKTGDYLECQVLLEGKVLPHTMVKVWSRLNHTVFVQDIYTEKDGTFRFPISKKGIWMVSTVRLSPFENAGVKFKSYSSTLVFGIE